VSGELVGHTEDGSEVWVERGQPLPLQPPPQMLADMVRLTKRAAVDAAIGVLEDEGVGFRSDDRDQTRKTVEKALAAALRELGLAP
jgi:hypothetical protein